MKGKIKKYINKIFVIFLLSVFLLNMFSENYKIYATTVQDSASNYPAYQFSPEGVLEFTYQKINLNKTDESATDSIKYIKKESNGVIYYTVAESTVEEDIKNDYSKLNNENNKSGIIFGKEIKVENGQYTITKNANGESISTTISKPKASGEENTIYPKYDYSDKTLKVTYFRYDSHSYNSKLETKNYKMNNSGIYVIEDLTLDDVKSINNYWKNGSKYLVNKEIPIGQFSFLTGLSQNNDGENGNGSTVHGSKVSNCSTSRAAFADQYLISNLGSDYSYYFRYEGENSEEVRSLISELAIEAPNNDNIGYSMDSAKRSTFDSELQKTSDNHPKNITNICYADCSGAVFTILRAVGRILNMNSFSSLPVGSTDTMGNGTTLENAGFKKYRFNASELQPGDLLLRLKSEFPSYRYDHAVIFVGDANGTSSGGGGGNSWNSVDIDKTLVNLDEQNFSFAGTPKTVTYEGESKFSVWLFSLISQFATYIVSIIINGIFTAVAGWGLLFESAINTAIAHIEGNA